MISLNVQWVPVDDRAGIYEWNENDNSSRRVKKVTFFGVGEMRGHERTKVVTPPSSDYTDAYLSTFASKSIPTRHIHRFNTSVFATSAPIPLKPSSASSFISNPMKTSLTRFINTNNTQISDFIDQPIPSSSIRSSISSSSFISEKPIVYDTFSRKPYTSPQAQTYTSSYSTSLRPSPAIVPSIVRPSIDSTRSTTTFSTRSQQSESSSPIVYRSQIAYESVFKPMPLYSLDSYPPSTAYTTPLSSSTTESTYTSYEPSESIPLSTSSTIDQISTNERIMSSAPKIEKQIDRPETLLFRHDENIRSSQVSKASLIVNQSPETPYIQEELKVEPESSYMDDLAITSSAPIQILENTLNKYDSLINEISEVLASVSPLSSTISSMSPGKSVLDYQLSSDSSPMTPYKRIDTQLSQQSTTPMKSDSSQAVKPSHFIREDSYDQIVTAISDLDTVIDSPSDTQKPPETINEEREESSVSPRDRSNVPSPTREEIKSTIPSLDDYQFPLESKEQKEETKEVSVDEQQTSPVVEDQKDVLQAVPAIEEQSESTVGEIKEETKTLSADEQQPLTTTREDVKEESAIPVVVEEPQISAPAVEENKEIETSAVSKEEKEEIKTPSIDQIKTEPMHEGETNQERAAVPTVEQSTESFKEEANTTFTDENQTPVIIQEEKEEQPLSSSTITANDKDQIPSASKEDQEEYLQTSFIDQPQLGFVTEEEKKDESQTLPADEQQSLPVVQEEKEHKDDEMKVSVVDQSQTESVSEEKQEETKIQPPFSSEEESTVAEEHHQIPSTSEQENEDIKTQSIVEHQTPSTTEQEDEKTNLSSATLPPTTSADEIFPSTELKSDEKETVDQQLTVEDTSENTEFVQQQTGLLPNVPNDIAVIDETPQTSDDLTSSKKAERHVRWDETVIDNEDDEISLSQSFTEESSAAEDSSVATLEDNSTTITAEQDQMPTDESKTAIDQQVLPSDMSESQIIFDQTTNLQSSIESPTVSSSEIDQQITESEFANMQITSAAQQFSASSSLEDQMNEQKTADEHVRQTDITERQARSLSPLETPSILSESTDQQNTLSDLTESQLDDSEQQILSTSATDIQSVPIIDSSVEDTLTSDEVSTTTSDVLSKEINSEPIEESQPIKLESQEEETIEDKKVETSSPITETIPHETDISVIESTTLSSEPVVSSDVYHGYSSEQNQDEQDVSSIDNDTTTKSLLASLREIITTSVTPLVESIQDVVSNMQTSAATSSSKTERETTDLPEDEIRLAATSADESIHEATTEPITTITSSISTAIPNLQSDEQEMSTTSTTEDEQIQSSFSDSIEEKLPRTTTSPTETPEKVVTTDESLTAVHEEDEQVVKEVDNTRNQAVAYHNELYDSFVDDSTVSTPTDIISPVVEQVHEQKEYQEPVSIESLPSKTEHVESVLETPSATLEQINISEKQDTIPVESSLTDISSTPLIGENAEQLLPTESKQLEESVVSTPVTQHDEQPSVSTSISSERAAIVDQREKTPSESTEIISVDQKIQEPSAPEVTETTSSTTTNEQVVSEQIDLTDQQNIDENTTAESKPTLEVIRDAITHPLTTITEKLQSILSSSSSEHTEEKVIDATEDITEILKEQQVSEAENADIIKTNDIEPTETKTTFETIRDVITHPLAAITEKFQSVMGTSETEPVDQSSSDALKTSLDISEQTTELESLDSSEPKTTLETLRDVITHPLATITEKIQHVFSSSTNEEAPLSEEQISAIHTDQHKDVDDVTETVEDVLSHVPDETSSSQEKEQILAHEGSDSYLDDQIYDKHETETSTEKVSHVTDNEENEFKPSSTNEIDSDTNKILLDTTRGLIDDIINSVTHELSQISIKNEQIDYELNSPVSPLTSPVTVITVEDRFENEADMTWANLVGEKSSEELLNQSYERIERLMENVVQTSDNMTMRITEDRTVVTIPPQSLPSIENTDQAVDIMQQYINESESDSTSAITQTEILPSTSSTNTDDDSYELIHALQGHSIIHPSSPFVQEPTTIHQTSTSSSALEKPIEQSLQVPEKSSSSTTSSQVTSSDRYVSYAIHEMGDSSQERLPAFPVAADIPIYQVIQPTSPENHEEQQVVPEPPVTNNQNLVKDDDLTEFDATENLTSYSDDVHMQKPNMSLPNREANLDASSTDEDVDDENFNEFDQSDVGNLSRIMDEITQHNNSLSGEFGETYQRYDVSNSSSASVRPQMDDIYMIPGYPGLWRPSADDDNSSQSALANDADDEDEKNQSIGKTVTQITHPAKRQVLSQQQTLTNEDFPVRSDTIDIFNRPLNEFSFDPSESDSFKTCASTITSSLASKQQKQTEFYPSPIPEQQEYQQSPDEKIILIRERERGVSLPVTMVIDYDDMALRLSSSTPYDAPLYPATEPDLPSPSTISEAIQKTTSSSRASTPSLSSNESEQQKLSSSSWLNTTNTITTMIEGLDGPLEARTTIHKSARGPISIAECEEQGKSILIENTSRSKSIALGGWTIRQENTDTGEIFKYTFPENCLLKPNHSLKVLSKSNESERRNGDLIASLLSSWHVGSNLVTKLINAEGKDRGALTKKTSFS